MLMNAFRLSIWLPVVAAAATVYGGVVSNYTVNGETVYEGMTFKEIRGIAGDPLGVEEVDGNNTRVEWVYHCARAGSGPCEVVKEGGKSEMRIRFQRGRLKIVRFARL